MMAPNDEFTVVEEALARLAVLEDVGEEDLTARVVPAAARAAATVRARGAGVLSGVGVAACVFRVVDPAIEVETQLQAGARFGPGDRILTAVGPARSLLTAERSALNFLQHLSGVATATALFVEAAQGTSVRITDTRKTVPGLRLLEKEAVAHGGGVNHRLGLYDAIMIKDNHIDAAGGIPAAVHAARTSTPGVPIIVEARSLFEAEEAARLGVGRILLDNLAPEAIAACVAAIQRIESGLPTPSDESTWLPGTRRAGDPNIQIEVSGGITLSTLARSCLPGVDFISVGAITHSAAAVDLTMDLTLLD